MARHGWVQHGTQYAYGTYYFLLYHDQQFADQNLSHHLSVELCVFLALFECYRVCPSVVCVCVQLLLYYCFVWQTTVRLFALNIKQHNRKTK